MKRQYRKISVRTVNAFLKRKGMDPKELESVVSEAPAQIKLKKKTKTRIENVLSLGHSAMVHMRGKRVVVRDLAKRYNFQSKAILRKAHRIAKRAMEQANA